jgi:hypothetical protein
VLADKHFIERRNMRKVDRVTDLLVDTYHAMMPVERMECYDC